MMKVTKINWFDRDARIADVWVSDGTFECKAYADPSKVSEVGDKVGGLSCLHSTEIYSALDPIPHLEPDGRHEYGIKAVGRIVDLKEQYVEIGGMLLIIDEPLPGDMKEGDWVQFNSSRVDVV